MLPFILGALVVGSIVEGVLTDVTKQQATGLQEFKRNFLPLAGDRRILVEDRREPGTPIIRRYGPAFDPLPWELYVGMDDDGMEQFAFRFHPLFKVFRVQIRARHSRPLDLKRELDAGGWEAHEDPLYKNRYRYSHPDQGKVPWFIVKVKPFHGPSWVFEHQSLYGEVVRARPALSPPSAPKAGADYAASLSKSVARAAAQMVEAQRTTDQIARELAKLKAEIPGMIDAARRHAASPEGVAERLAAIKKIAAVTQQALFEIEAATDIHEALKDQMMTIVLLEGDRNLELLRRAVEAELDAVKRGRS